MSLTLSQSLISNNTAGAGGQGDEDRGGDGGNGGGLSLDSTSGTASLINSTISGNTAGAGGASASSLDGDGGLAGGIEIGPDLTPSIDNCTIYGNSAGSGNVTGIPSGLSVGNEVNLKNSILAGNENGVGFTTDCTGLLTSHGYNLVGVAGGGCNLADTTGDLWGTIASPYDPELDVLADYGGPTQTHAPLASGSPGVNAGNGTDISGSAVTVDQRGVARPQGAANDIGAFEWPINFNLTQTVAGTGAGTVVSSPAGINCDETNTPCSASFRGGSQALTLTATAGTGSSFIGWSGDCSGSASPLTLSLDGDKNCTATFDLNEHTVSVNKGGSGSGTVSSNVGGIDCGATCMAVFNYGDDVTLTASPASGSIFTGWSGDCSGAGASFNLTVDADKNCTASFALNQQTLTTSTSGTGSGTVTSNIGGIDCGSTCSAVITKGESVTLTATAGSGSVFSGWSGDCSGTADSFSLLMDGDKNCDARFDLVGSVSYQVSVTKDGDGSGAVTADSGDIDCGATCAGFYGQGTNLTLTATPEGGSVFSGWSGDCSGDDQSVSILVDGHKNCVAAFDQKPTWTLNLTVDPEEGGTLTGPGLDCPGDCTETFLDGEEITVTANPNSGYSVLRWIIRTGAESNSRVGENSGSVNFNIIQDSVIEIEFISDDEQQPREGSLCFISTITGD